MKCALISHVSSAQAKPLKSLGSASRAKILSYAHAPGAWARSRETSDAAKTSAILPLRSVWTSDFGGPHRAVPQRLRWHGFDLPDVVARGWRRPVRPRSTPVARA